MSAIAGSEPVPGTQYDKFGFLIATDRREPRQRSRRPRSRSRSRTPSPRRRRRDKDDAWEGAFDRSKPPPPPPPPAPTYAPQPSYSGEVGKMNITSKVETSPVQSSHQPMNSYPMDSYGQLPPGYNNFADVAPPPMGHGMVMGPEVSVPPPATGWGQLPPPAQIMMPLARDERTKQEAIASELRNQRATLALQKDKYLKKAAELKRELESLKEQKAELRGDPRRSLSPNTQKFLKENSKLQTKLQNKLKTMNNVIDMFDGIIGNSTPSGDLPPSAEKKTRRSRRSKSDSSSSDSSSDDEKSSSRQKKKTSVLVEKKYNYAYYDPEMHWCRVCNEFPATAKDYLTHLHTPQHHRAAAAHMEAPWHNTPNLNEGFPNHSGAPIKRTPIKGLQFFVPSTAWYCKLCDQWIGDLHCASAHLKSISHSENYTKFTELNPHWEMDWMSDREKNFEKNRKQNANQEQEKTQPQYSPHTISFDGDGFHTKSKKSDTATEEDSNMSAKLETKKSRKKKDKKEKKKSKKKRFISESSDSSDSSTEEEEEEKDEVKNEPKPREEKQPEAKMETNDASPDDRIINQWMCVQGTPEQEKKLLEEVKNRVKSRAGERPEQTVDERVVSREREVRALLTINSEAAKIEALKEKTNSRERENRNEKEKEKERDRDRDRDRDRYREKDRRSRDRDRERDRDRRSRDRDRDRDRRSRDRDRYRDRDRRSRDRDRDRRDDRSRRGRYYDSDDDKYKKPVIEKRYMMDTEFKPYPTNRKDESEKPKRPPKQHSVNNNSNNSNDSKKMPFIGKMPLYKTLGSGEKPPKRESEPMMTEQESLELARRKRDEINAHLGTFKETFITTMAKKNELIEAQFPEPKLIIPTLFQQPSLMDLAEMMIPTPVDISSLPQTIHHIQPAIPLQPVIPTVVPAPVVPVVSVPVTLTVTPAATATKSNSRLHKDFQDALDIIFPSDAPPEDGEIKPIDESIITEDEDLQPTDMIEGEAEMSDMMSSDAINSGLDVSYQNAGIAVQGMDYVSQIGMIQQASMMGYEYSAGMYDQAPLYDMSGQAVELQPPPPVNPVPKAPIISNQNMEDLAMLGIDAEDVGASGF